MAQAAGSTRTIASRPTAAPAARLATIDGLRGLALCGMVLFHVEWDLAYWGWQDSGPADSPAWMLFGHAVAATFLFVSGFCLVLARRGGLAPALRRITVLGGTALLISSVTYGVFPEDFIFFGIIHCIALSNLVGLAFLEAPVAITIFAGLVAAVAPSLWSSAIFDHPAAWGLGLSTSLPATLDYRPLLPWISAVLFGIAAARLIRPVPPIRLPGTAWLQRVGRHSLSIYIVHQPLLFGLFFLLAMAHPAQRPDRRAGFSQACRAQCVAAGAGQTGCAAACDCVEDRMASHLSRDAGSSPPSNADIDAASRSCVDPPRP